MWDGSWVGFAIVGAIVLVALVLPLVIHDLFCPYHGRWRR